MDTLGSEVGQKMRCAVKAKLIELGTGGSTGYIDDELPDYVMIMVANKRSKQQMIEDLKLFLGTNTEVFVVWLHQVLEKLQEVTLPAGVVQKNKRKSSDTTDVPTKKEKKERKKDKKRQRVSAPETKKVTPDVTPPPPPSIGMETTPIISSITDVFADQLIKKAKLTEEVAQQVTKNEVKAEEAAAKAKSSSGNDFDIPTIAEMAETASNDQTTLSARERDVQELNELQRRINRAKKQLRAIDSDKESEDEDFLNLKDDDSQEDFEQEEATTTEMAQVDKPVRHRSPIIFDRKSASDVTSERSSKRIKESGTKKLSILERLKLPESKTVPETKNNSNKISLSAHRRAEKEIYVRPGYKKPELSKRSTTPPPERHHDKERHRDRENRKTTTAASSTNSRHSRIESRVIVARSTADSTSYDEEAIDVPINSVVKIKPRPQIPAHKQASKNLLLRAVAEAQKSTALANPRAAASKLPPIQKTLPSVVKKYDQKTIKSNIIIQIPSDMSSSTAAAIHTNNSESDEYIPEPVKTEHDSSSNDEIVYIPRSINLRHRIDIRDKSSKDSRTQFVVTLDGRYEKNKSSTPPVVGLKQQRSSSCNETRSTATNTTPTSQEKKSSSSSSKPKTTKVITNDIAARYSSSDDDNEVTKSDNKSLTPKRPKIVEVTTTTTEKVKEQHQSPSSSTKEVSKSPSSTQTRTITSLPTPKPITRFIIKTNDTTDDEKDNDKTASPPKEKIRRQRSKVSPIKFDLEKKKESSSASSSNHREFSSHTDATIHKYENIPPLLSAVTIPVMDPAKMKKEKCKYYPVCRLGDSCEFSHVMCKTFPNCKYGDKCMYIHPSCKFDMTCTRPDCNFSHSTRMLHTAPPLASHVIPVQNYKSISATPVATMCKYYPGCINPLCTFFHPKLCHFGKNCMNKVECNFYHHEGNFYHHHEVLVKDKHKWISPTNI